jgi:site-specific DNA-methyltransferase (cytosine-N4-specific)
VASKTSEIPVGTQFSPSLIRLPEFLYAIVDESGNKSAIQQAIFKPPVHLKRTAVPTSKRTASLPLESAIQYGLLDSTYTATDLAVRLASLSEDDLYEEFARHILLDCGGVRVIEGIQQMEADGLSVTGDSLTQYLSDQGFTVGVHNTAVNTMRMWLAKAGIFPEKGWDVDSTAKERLLGISDELIAAIVNLNEEQRSFLDALCRINPAGWYKAADVRDLAETNSGMRMSRSSLPKQFLEPLKSAGLIDYKSGGTSGGKSALLKTTDLFNDDVLEPFVARTVRTLDTVLTAYYTKRPQDIYADLVSTKPVVKGEALEAYAIHIMRLLGLKFVGWRKRAADTTGRAEVDVVLAGLLGGVATRWQVQCKNKPGGNVDLEDVAKEVGLVPLTHATHVMVLGNSRFTKDARTFAARINEQTPLTIYLLDKRDFDAVRASPGALAGVLRAQSEGILRSQPTASLWGLT